MEPPSRSSFSACQSQKHGVQACANFPIEPVVKDVLGDRWIDLPNAKWNLEEIDFFGAKGKPECALDEQHLNPRASIRFTKELAKKIQQGGRISDLGAGFPLVIYSTPEFLALLFVLVPLYRLIPYMGRRVVLVIASLLFIFWAGAITTALLLLSVMVIWGVVRLGISGWGKTLPVQAGVALLALNLVFWKYTPWILTQFGVDPDTPFLRFLADVGLPIGISFYTLQGIAYLVDYHRGEAPPRGFVDFLLFKAFFAQLIAGPIVRHYELFPQLDRMPVSTTAQMQSGIELFALGFFKKLVLGDGSAQFVDPVFANMSEFRNGDVLLAVVLYTVQIYGDFSGYTDMGRGAARMLGIELPENFSAPYLSTSLREFWRRWHITFGRWLRDYIYIPLGGNRRGFRRTLLNVGATMTLCGLWHGAAWNFVLWGVYNGVIMMAEHVQERLFGWNFHVSWRYRQRFS